MGGRGSASGAGRGSVSASSGATAPKAGNRSSATPATTTVTRTVKKASWEDVDGGDTFAFGDGDNYYGGIQTYAGPNMKYGLMNSRQKVRVATRYVEKPNGGKEETKVFTTVGAAKKWIAETPIYNYKPEKKRKKS